MCLLNAIEHFREGTAKTNIVLCYVAFAIVFTAMFLFDLIIPLTSQRLILGGDRFVRSVLYKEKRIGGGAKGWMEWVVYKGPD